MKARITLVVDDIEISDPRATADNIAHGVRTALFDTGFYASVEIEKSELVPEEATNPNV